MTAPEPRDPIIGHADIAAYADAKVNLPKAVVNDRRAQLEYLRRRLEHYIDEHPDYDLVKIRGSGSVTKGTALKGSSDADMAAYVRAAAVGGADAPESGLLAWLRYRLIEIYGDTKSPEDFQPSDHAVGILFHASGLKVDVAPVIYEGDPDDRGYLVTPDADHGWRGQRLDFDDYPTALEQVFAYIVRTRLADRIAFDDYYQASELPGPTGAAIEVFDPVNPDNNIVDGYTLAESDRLVAAAHDALETITESEYADTKGRAVACWKRVLGPGFGV